MIVPVNTALPYSSIGSYTMSAFKLVKVLLSFVHLLAQREERKQVAAQVRFRREAAAKSKVLREAASRAHAKAHALDSQAATASAQASIGCNKINEAERVAASLRNQLDFVVQGN
jgi:hypothetical protein